MEQHFGVIPEIPFRDSLLRYAEAKKRENPKGFNASRRYQLQLLLDTFGTLMLSEIDAGSIRDFADMRRKTVTDSTLHRDLAVLRAIMNKAREEGDLTVLPIFPKVKLPKGRTRWLTEEEERRLLKEAPAHLKLLIAFALDTGGRRSELFNLD